MKVLINVPCLKLQGGVAVFYNALYNFWSETIRYNVVGKRGPFSGSGLFWLPWDTLKFIFQVLYFQPDMIVLNPSLGKSALYRDSYFFRLALFFNKKVVIFFRGWDMKYAKEINKKLFINLFNKASCILVLACDFKRSLEAWGITKPIYTVTTKVDDNLLDSFDIQIRTGRIKNLLFLARIEKEKGVFVAIDVFKILKEKCSFLTMTVVGYGKAFNEAVNYVNNNRISGVTFTGNLQQFDLIDIFIKSDLYIFPTFYGEGMPNSVLEAMAFGLPVITRPVGGLVDFFQNGKMGEMLDSLEPSDFAKCIEKYMLDEDLTKKTSLYNHVYAKENFMASKVAKRLEAIWNCIK